MALSFLDTDADIFSLGGGTGTLLTKKKAFLDEEGGGSDFGDGGDGGGDFGDGGDGEDAQAAAIAAAKAKADADAAAAAAAAKAQADADAAAAAQAALTSNIFNPPATTTTAPTVTTTDAVNAADIFGGAKVSTVPTVTRGIVESGGTTTTTTTGTTADGNQLVEFKPPDNKTIGADGTSAADLLRQPLVTTNAPTDNRTIISQPGVTYPGTGESIFGGGSRTSAGTSSVTQVTPTTATTPTDTRPKTIDDFLQSGTKPTAEEMSGLIDQRLKAAQATNKQLGGTGELSNDDISALVTEVYDEIYTKEGGLKSLTKAPETGPQRPGIPLVIPIPGLDPTTAAIISAIGLIRSGGKVSTIDPTDPLGSLINIGKGIFDTSSGTPGGAGGGAGGGTAGGTGTGGTLKIGTATQEELDAIEKENEARRTAEDLARQGASAAALKAAQEAAQKAADERAAKERAQEEETARIRAGVMGVMGQSAENRAKADEAAALAAAEAEKKRKADEAAALAAAEAEKKRKADELPPDEIEDKPTDPNARVVTSCPSPETPILLANGSEIPAGDLHPGMWVRTMHEHTGHWGDYPVTSVRIVKDKRISIDLGNKKFVCSPTHKFSTGDGWRDASEYSVGDVLQRYTVRGITPLEDGDVVAITVDDAHTYVSDGLLSHNKTPIEQPPSTTTTPVISGRGSATVGVDESVSTSSCPSPETPILLPDLTTVPAGDLKVGMNVRARMESELVWGDYPVTRVEIVKDQRLKFTFDYGTFICSPTHKFCHNDWEWREAQSYSVGDEIQDHKILAIENDGVGDVVVITVDEAHTYVAGPFLSHNKQTSPVITTVNNTKVPTTPTTPTTPAGGTFNVTVTGDQTPIEYTAPKAGDPFQRYSWEEASSQLGMLNTPVGQRIIGYQKDASGKDVPVYSRVPLDEQGNPLTVGGAITSEYGKMAGGMTQADIKRLRDTFGGFIGDLKGPKGEDLTLQQSLTKAAADQTAAANRALREGNLADAAKFGMEAKRLRDEANAQLYGDTGTLGQYATAAQNQVARDIEALRAAERGELSRESIRSAQQAAREAAGARGQVMSRGAAAQEVLNREAAIQQRQQQARANLAQSMGQLGQGIGYQAANVFDPMAAVLGQQYGMQTSNVGLNQALYNQAMGLASGQGGYGFAQQMVNPFSQYAADVYGTNVNARNAFAISEANRLAALEAAKMGEAAARNAANTKLALGGVDFLYKLGLGKGWWE
jgi:hypothetical protein